jgi:NADH-quinone oxidoreductase subunit L
MSQLGGLRRRAPATYVATMLGGLALVGVPPLSGGLSKDAVLDSALAAARGRGPSGVDSWVGVVVLASALATVVVTAAYLTRLVLRTFHGTPRSDAAAHDPPPLMRRPIEVLAFLTVIVGVIGVRTAWLPGWVGEPGESLAPRPGLTALALALAAGGALAVGLAWRRAPAEDPVLLLGTRLAAALRNGLYVDAAQDRLVVRPTRRVARLVSTADSVLVDGAVESTGIGSQRLGRLLARLEAGNVQLYLTGLAAGAVLVALAVAVAVTA